MAATTKDLLIGGGGNDILDGGEGGDNLAGGADADTFVWSWSLFGPLYDSAGNLPGKGPSTTRTQT